MIIKEKQISLKKALPLLESSGLSAPENTDYTCGIFSGEMLIGTGSISRNIIKGIAVHSDYRGENITSRIVSHLTDVFFKREIFNFFIFTKDSEKGKFADLGFTIIGQVENSAALLEYDSSGIMRYRESLSAVSGPVSGCKGCIVMNCNPFTKGHLYLIEKAASESDHLFILVVEEDLSVFPFSKRIELVKKGTEHLDNVTVLPGGPYTISSATFPAYFAKKNKHAELFSLLDTDIFIRHTAKALSINKRFIGEEPYCPVTSLYNRCLKTLLPEAGIEVTEVKRIKAENEIISASKVRSLIREGNINGALKYLPPSTQSFLLSDEAEEIIIKIKKNNTRH